MSSPNHSRPRRKGRLLAPMALAVAAVVALAVWLFAGKAVDLVASGGASDQVERWLLARRQDELLAPGDDPAPVAFEVGAGEVVASVAERLAAEGLVRSAAAFELLAKVRGDDRGIQAGHHTLSRAMSAEEVLAALQLGMSQGVRVTIPEGRRLEEVALILAAAGFGPEEAFIAAAVDPESGRSAELGGVASRPPERGLEGYLFPDTYDFHADSTPVSIRDRLLANFAERVGDDIVPHLEGLGLSLHEAITIASIVEREAQVPEERPLVARVFVNRLADGAVLLEADPTVQYALGYQHDSGTWWKRPLTFADLEVDSPYNTYRVPGVPPGPIANPGLASIRAVAEPAPGPWRFFVANERLCDGSHVFAETFDEHLDNVANYQVGGCGR